MQTNAPRGTNDLIGRAAAALKLMNETANAVFSKYGYGLIQTPIFELEDVFVRGIGEATDVVGKEMFHVLSKNAYERLEHGEDLRADQKLCLRPEGTASVVRSAIQHNLTKQASGPIKFYYVGPMFRCERPQKGRLREFNQIGVECFCVEEPELDAEMIIMLLEFYKTLGIEPENIRLLINTMGDDDCRPTYIDSIREFLINNADELCDECKERANTNPLRALDCKNEKCQITLEAAPKITDYLCDACKEHYERVKYYLDAAGVNYIEDTSLVRGLDYYTRTVFEVQAISGLGAQNALGGGGRYDKLFETMGGDSTPGIGFALGFERISIALEELGKLAELDTCIDVFVARHSEYPIETAFAIVSNLRNAGLSVEFDYQGRSLKSQFKQSDRLGAKFTVILGPDEFENNVAKLRNMQTREEETISLAELSQAILKVLANKN